MIFLHHYLSQPMVFEASLLLLSIGAGIFGAILGLGGGIIIVPALTLLYGINIRYAVGASIVSVIATSSGAAASFVRDRITNVRVALLLEVATTVGALGGAMLSPYLPTRLLFMVFALILFYSAILMYRKKGQDHSITASNDWFANKLRLHSSFPDFRLKKEISYSVDRVPMGFSLMLGAGLISGLLGIGSGVLKVPAMDTAMRLPIKVSSATSSFMIGVTAAASAGAYFMRGNIIPIIAAPVAIGVLLGSWWGTRVAMKLQNSTIRKMFLVVLVIISVEMGLKSLGIEFK